jgi:hypothetical protein
LLPRGCSSFCEPKRFDSPAAKMTTVNISV